MKKGLGYHLLLELHGCPAAVLSDSLEVENAFLDAAKVSGANIVKTVFHHFNPHGVSGIIVIAESHFAVHTWPEYGYVAVDLFSCSNKIDLDKAVESLKKYFIPQNMSVVGFERGILV